jgi:hypothetical protein
MNKFSKNNELLFILFKFYLFKFYFILILFYLNFQKIMSFSCMLNRINNTNIRNQHAKCYRS